MKIDFLPFSDPIFTSTPAKRLFTHFFMIRMVKMQKFDVLLLCSLLKLLFSRRFKLCWVLKTKNSKICQSVTLFFFQTAFFWVLSIVGFEMAKNLKIRQIRHFLTTSLLKNCFVYIFAESSRESAVRPRKTECISRQNVAKKSWNPWKPPRPVFKLFKINFIHCRNYWFSANQQIFNLNQFSAVFRKVVQKLITL